MKHPETRNTIFQEDAEVIDQQSYAGAQYLLRLQAPETAAHARPGSFVHLQCADDLPMRRPMSIMRADKNTGWIDILYKVHGEGTAKLAQRKTGDRLSLLGPIGVPFRLDNYRRFPLLIGGGVGIPPMIFLAEHIRKTDRNLHPLVIMGSEVPFPFKPRPSQILVSGMPEGVIAAMPLLEDWKIASRLASLQGYAGCFEGYVTDLARYWLDSMGPEQRNEIEIFSCGPTPMLKAVSKLAHDYALPCQISMEEYMACAVGGCAGCAIEIHTETGPAMKRVCVDGPVFEAASVFPQPASSG
jgi:dihydroorotate dehydrogenase electron transfer subunit